MSDPFVELEHGIAEQDAGRRRPLQLSRAEAEFIDDACLKDGAPQWWPLQDEIRRIFGMSPINREVSQP